VKESLSKIKKEILSCKKCPLWKKRKNAVPGEGPKNAKIMFIGEAPGKNEDATGRPFVGRAGKFLNYLLEKNGIKRKNVFITSVLKCVTNKPNFKFIEICKEYTFRQIEAINPKKIVLLGNFAIRTFLGKKIKVSQIHGKIIKYENRILIPTFHPAAGMRFKKIGKLMEEDFKKI